MQNLPNAAVYEKEFKYMPWGILIKELQALLVEKAPKGGLVLDLLCGPGYLLSELQKARPDLSLTGVDLEPEFIRYAQGKYSSIDFIIADAFKWGSDKKYDVILCTAGLHHLPYSEQEPFIQKISGLLKEDGFAVIADPYTDDSADENERKLAGAKLGYEYLVATIKNDAPADMIQAAVQILQNDVSLIEYKSSVKKIEPFFKKHFPSVEVHKTWPNTKSDYGDYYFVLKKHDSRR